MYDVIIVGGGPAGLTATVYCSQKRLDTLLITKNLGGKTNLSLQLPFYNRHKIINGSAVVDRFSSQIDYMRFVRNFDTVTKIERAGDNFTIHTGEGKTHATQALIIATGARGQRLNVPGEKEFSMRGICYSTMSYASLFLDRQTAVVGDGCLALRSAAELASYARHVFLIMSETSSLDDPLGQRLERSRKVTIMAGYQVQAIEGDRFARSVVIARDQDRQTLHVDGIFIETGLTANSELVASEVALDDQKHIKIDAFNRSSCPGIFAAGDVTNAFAEQVLIALGEGTKAALSVYEYLLDKGLVFDKRQGHI